MATIQIKEGSTLDVNGHISMPAMFLPSFRAIYAVSKKVQNNFMFYIRGGLGDAICAEPSIRFAVNNFKDCTFTVATYWPELFSHLPLHGTINFFDNPAPPESYFENYYVFKTLFNGDELHSEFLPHFFTHVVDYTSIAMFRMQLDPKDKNIVLQGKSTGFAAPLLIHPGRTWQSRTIPADYWNEVITELLDVGVRPTIIGATTKDPKLGTVNLKTEGCLDMRNKLTIAQTIDLCQKAKVVLTNDSSPVHMTASGDAWLGMFSTVKRPDLLTHYRGPENRFGWRTENLTKGGLWETLNMNPNNSKEFFFHEVPDEQLRSWLPRPKDVAIWAMIRMNKNPNAP